MGKLLSLLLASFMAPQALSAADDPALHLVQEFVAAVRHNPGQAKTYAEDGVNLDFGDYVGGRNIDRFAKEASNCQLRSISQPSVPKNWNLDGARYFQIIWRCPLCEAKDYCWRESLRPVAPAAIIESVH
jgi:hypothetical protein